MKVKSLSHVQLLATTWAAAYQAPASMGFSRQEYWSGVPLPSPTLDWVVSKDSLLYLWTHPGDYTPGSKTKIVEDRKLPSKILVNWGRTRTRLTPENLCYYARQAPLSTVRPDPNPATNFHQNKIRVYESGESYYILTLHLALSDAPGLETCKANSLQI